MLVTVIDLLSKGTNFEDFSMVMGDNKIKFNFCNFISNLWNTFGLFMVIKNTYNKDNLSNIPPTI